MKRFAWSAFLGCSWTWCIGMFLPALLVRDYGVVGWIIFAIPNVIGAAAMGAVLQEARASRRFVDKHRAACTAFSAVTILFHIFFLAWVVRGLVGPAVAWLALPFTIVFLWALWTDRRATVTGWLVLLCSLAIFAASVGIAPPPPAPFTTFGTAPLANFLGLTAVCFFGFTFCPYLDLTFHRARRATGRNNGVTAFFAGFGGCFAVMIIFSLWYARWLIPGNWALLPRRLAWLIALHMLIQSAFTIAAHIRSMVADWRIGSGRGLLLGGLPAVALLVAYSLGKTPTRPGITPGEMVYTLFLGFYGLIFPGYVWICATGRGRETRAPLAWMLALLAAAPLFWFGFVDGRMVWTLPGLLILLLIGALWPMRARR